MAVNRLIHGGMVGLVTIISDENYGNRLQNYAMQQIIDGLGFTCTTIANFPKPSLDERKRDQAAPSLSLRALLQQTGILRMRRQMLDGTKERARIEAQRLRALRKANGRAFTRAHIRESEFTLYRDTPTGHVDAMFDNFVVGSDQVWNPNFRALSEVDFLTFASKPKRIAFSASIGVSEIPQEFRAFYRERLKDFAHISVREEAAADEVRALTGRTVPVTLDPTLMLPAADWSALAKRHPTQPAGDYLVTYFLGPRPEACQRLIDRCVARLGLTVVHLNDTAAADTYAAGPAEFLGFLRDARLVCTDSFHGVIFATLFGNPFVSFERTSTTPSMSSRLDTLLATLHLEHRRFRGEPSGKELERILEPDFAHVQPILDVRTAQARTYLAHALGQDARVRAASEAALPAPA